MECNHVSDNTTTSMEVMVSGDYKCKACGLKVVGRDRLVVLGLNKGVEEGEEVNEK